MKRPATSLDHLVNCPSLAPPTLQPFCRVGGVREKERCLMNRRRLFALHWQPTWCGRATRERTVHLRLLPSVCVEAAFISPVPLFYQIRVFYPTKHHRWKRRGGRNNVLTEKWMRVKTHSGCDREKTNKTCKGSSSLKGFIGGGIRTRNRIVGSEMQ